MGTERRKEGSRKESSRDDLVACGKPEEAGQGRRLEGSDRSFLVRTKQRETWRQVHL